MAAQVQVLVAAADTAEADALAAEAGKAGYRIAARAVLVKEAVARAGKERPALVLMDVRLGSSPAIRGAIKKIQTGCGIPVVLVAPSDAAVPDFGRSAVVPYGCLVRPFGPRQFREVTRAAIALHSSIQAGADPQAQKIAHDINNMLSSALANIQLSRRSCPHKERVLGHLDNAETSVLRARDHSRQLLASVGGTPDAAVSAGSKKTGRKATDQEDKKRPAARYRILLMDDEESILSATSDMLTFLGHEVTVAGNGDLAVSRFRKAIETGSPFDAVILDITVPGGKGAGETLPLLRNIDPQVRAIVSTGYSTHPLVTGFAANGFVAALVKPYGFKELEDALFRAFKK